MSDDYAIFLLVLNCVAVQWPPLNLRALLYQTTVLLRLSSLPLLGLKQRPQVPTRPTVSALLRGVKFSVTPSFSVQANVSF